MHHYLSRDEMTQNANYFLFPLLSSVCVCVYCVCMYVCVYVHMCVLCVCVGRPEADFESFSQLLPTVVFETQSSL